MQVKRNRGLTLIEAMIALTIVAFTSLGALSYQYHGAKHFRMGRAEMTATQIGELLLEDWKSVGGVDSYRIGGPGNHNPVSLNVGFTGSTGNYQINRDVTASDGRPVSDRITFYTTLMPPTDVETDPKGFAGTLRQITVIVKWRGSFGSGAPGAGDPALTFTTYVRNQD